MKKALLIFLLLLAIPIAAAITEYPDLSKGESFIVKDKNITLLGISMDSESVLVCVNNEVGIISDSKTINGVGISLRGITDNEASLKISYRCPNCVCSDGCSNKLCSAKKAGEAAVQAQDNASIAKPRAINITSSKPAAESETSLFVLLALMLIIAIPILILIKKAK